MSNNTKVIFAFIVGTVVGAAMAYRYVVKTMKNEMIDIDPSVADDRDDSIETIIDIKREAADQAKNKHDITEYASIIRNESYNPEKSDESQNAGPIDKPYVISPDEFGECGYETVNLTYYSDDVLVDENDELVDDISEIVGEDFTSHFGEYEEDSIYMRNDSKKCDYEILRDYNPYHAL